MDVPMVRRNDWGVLDPPSLPEWRPTRTVSVIIPAYRCQELVDLTLAALSRQPDRRVGPGQRAAHGRHGQRR